MSIHSYPKVHVVGHAALGNLLEGEVVIQEKLDGSQLSFGVLDGELQLRSSGSPIYPEAPEALFKRAVETVKAIEGQLFPGWIYRGEFLMRPKHHTVAYARVPHGHIALFDIEVGARQEYLEPEEVATMAAGLGLDVVPTLYRGPVTSLEQLQAYLGRESYLGGAPIEGIVLKNYQQFGRDGKVVMAKLVDAAFKERHKVEWKQQNPSQRDFIANLAGEYRTEARWSKAVQRLAEQGRLTGTPKDIGPLVGEVMRDTEDEDRLELERALWRHFWPQIRRQLTHGLPEWYQARLAAQAFTVREEVA